MSEDNNELLSSLLGMLGDNPEEKIKSALSSLGVGSEEKPLPEPSSQNGLDAETLLKITSLFSSVSGEDNRFALLSALKPFLSEEKRPKVDNALRLLKLAKVAETAGKTDILKNLKL